MIFFCPWCQESEWVDDAEEYDDDDDVIVELCEFCLLEEGLYFVLTASDFCGFLQDAYLLCEDTFLEEFEAA